MLTYNAFLFIERKNRGLSRSKMAKLLKMSYFSYYFLENGYLKPSKKQIEKISQALNVDYSQYFVGELTYPAELPEKDKRKIVSLGYRILGHIAFKITAIVFTLLSLSFTIFGLVGEDYYKSHKSDFFPDEYVAFAERLRENGTPHYSVVNTFLRPEYYIHEDTDVDESRYISIIGNYDEGQIDSLVFTAVYRSSNGRLLYEIVPNILSGYTGYLIKAKFTFSDKALTVEGNYEYKTHDNVSNYFITEIDEDGDKIQLDKESDDYIVYNFVLTLGMLLFEDDFNTLIEAKDPQFAPGAENKFQYLSELHIEGEERSFSSLIWTMTGKYIGIILTGAGLFVTLFAFIYGTRKGIVKNYRPVQLTIPDDEITRMKPDTKIFPPIPETLLEIIGIILVFIGSFRIVIYVGSYLNGTVGDSNITINISTQMQIFMVGMFLLYFIDFDIFLDDKRVFRNIAMYSIVYVCLYALENLLYNTLNTGSVVGELVQRIPLPNMFGTIACYYLIMCFLFYKPKWIKKKTGLIIYRCCSLIPVLYIFAAWFIYNGYNILYTADWPNYVRNIFNGEKIPFTMLAITYLFGLFFLRLYFERKYGVERAKIFFNGNKFIWIKNIMVSLIIILITITELILKQNVTAHKLGLGMYTNIFFLIPPLLLYHSHKGPRNVPLDWTTTALYILSIGTAYLLVVIMVITTLF